MEFFASRGKICTLPLPHHLILEFLAWADLTKSLSPASLRNYLSCLSRIQILLGFDGIKRKWEALAESFLQGVEMRPRPSQRPKAVRRAVSFPLLKILCHTVPDLQLELHEKLLMRAICTISFFGSVRIGELITKPENYLLPEKILKWSDAHAYEGAILLHINSTKVVHKGGDFIYLFPVNNPVICPVKALIRLRESATRLGIGEGDNGIFSDNSGAPWKRKSFDSILNILVIKTGLLKDGETVTGHSFRAGIPSALGSMASAEATQVLKEWGRWRSAAFEAYTKRVVSKKLNTFTLILNSDTPTNVGTTNIGTTNVGKFKPQNNKRRNDKRRKI